MFILLKILIFIMATLTNSQVNLKVISYNIAAKNNLGGLYDILLIGKPDIILLQEVHVSTDEMNTVLAKYNYEASVNNDISDEQTRGTAILWKLRLEVSKVHSLVESRLQSVDFGPITLFNVYAPSGQNNRNQRRNFFGSNLFMATRSLSQGGLPIIAGDFNCVVARMDTEANFENKRCPALEDLLSVFNYGDAFRILHHDQVDFTFYRQGCAAARLDRFYVPQELVNNVKSCYHKPMLSDHKYAVMIFEVPAGSPTVMSLPPSSSSYWKMNTRVLFNEDFLPNFVEVWEVLTSKEELYTNIAQWWEFCAKPGIQKFCKKFSSVISKGRSCTKTLLLEWLNSALTEGDWKTVNIICGKLNKFLQEDSMGFIVRSRHNQVLEEERGSLYHANREKKHANNTRLNKLKRNDVVITDQKTIEDDVIGFFNPLFNGFHRPGPIGGVPVNSGNTFVQDTTHLDLFLNGLGKLSPESRDSLEQPVELKGLEEIIKECDRNKSPGSDGLPYGFYQVTAHIIGETLVKLYQCILDEFRLTDSMDGGLTRLLSKVLGIPAVDELRPITLLCCDYKILTKYLTQRLLPVLPEVILSGQLSSIQRSNILFGVANILSSIEYVTLKKIGAAIISYDMFKAYDRVLVKFLCQVMKAMGFGDTFVRWVEMCHANITTRFLLEKLSDPIKLTFSIRQGDPWSMVLYILYIEPLLLRFRRELKGLKMASFNQVDEDFCDDVNVITENEDDFLIADRIIGEFEQVSGAILSRSKKTKVMGIGAWSGRQNWPIPWLKVEPELKIFGVIITPSYELSVRRNWEELLKKFTSCLISWRSRMLPTLRMRSDVLRIFGTSKLWYWSQGLPLPVYYAEQFEKQIRKFLWMGQLETLALDEVKNVPLSGGLRIPCVQNKSDALFIRQTCRILESKDKSPYKHVHYWLGLVLKKYFPDMARGVHSQIVPPYFNHMKILFCEAVDYEMVKVKELKYAAAKNIYEDLTSTLPPPKVVFKYELPYELIWQRLENQIMDGSAKNLLFKMINNIIPNRD